MAKRHVREPAPDPQPAGAKHSAVVRGPEVLRACRAAERYGDRVGAAGQPVHGRAVRNRLVDLHPERHQLRR